MKTKNDIVILYEDNHLVVVNKPAGTLVQGDSTGDETLADQVKVYIKHKYNKPGEVFLGVVHRLDRPVSGAVVFARTSKALERMNALFRDREVRKTYWALVKDRPPQSQDTLIHWLKKDHKTNKATAFNKELQGTKKAELFYKLIGRIAEYYLLEITPLTGRPHQIRVQLAKMGCPILGDLKYGAGKANKDGNIHLHSRELEFIHPVKKTALRVTARLPKDNIWQLFQ